MPTFIKVMIQPMKASIIIGLVVILVQSWRGLPRPTAGCTLANATASPHPARNSEAQEQSQGKNEGLSLSSSWLYNAPQRQQDKF